MIKQNRQIIAGIDEVGRGALAGPVAAAIVVVKKALHLRRVLKKHALRDSKLLTAKQREEIFAIIKDEPTIKWQVSFVWPKVIDRINIWQATLLAWQRCLKKINPQPGFLFLDGKMEIPKLEIGQKAIVRGDQKIPILSLASIMAKVSRDRLMVHLEEKYPQYGFARHKGYGTKLHLDKLKKFGPSEIHRKSFRPVFINLPFSERVYYVVSKIPSGQTMTYQQVAQQIGQPRAYRAIGNILNKNTNPQVPCHRVIRSDRKLGGYNQGMKKKEDLLKKEGLLLF